MPQQIPPRNAAYITGSNDARLPNSISFADAVTGDIGNNLKGPTGPTGPAGPTGPTGSPGSSSSVLIEEKILSSPSSSVPFNDIPGTYRHLRLIIFGQGSEEAAITLRFNGDSGSNYDQNVFLSIGNNVSYGGVYSGQSSASVGNLTGSIGTKPGFYSVHMPYYANTSFSKAIDSMGQYSQAGGARSMICNNTWNCTDAIVSEVVGVSSGNFVAGTRIALYGEY